MSRLQIFRPPPHLEIRNFAAMPGWLVASAFVAVIIYLTWKLQVSGTEWGYPPWLQYAALVAFWAGGYLAVGHLFRYPCSWLRVHPSGDAVFDRFWVVIPWRERLPHGAIQDVLLRRSEDSEGDPYFQTRIVLGKGREVTVHEGHSEAKQLGIAAMLRDRLGLPGPPQVLDATRRRR